MKKRTCIFFRDKQHRELEILKQWTYLPFFVTIISLVSWWKLLQSSASSSITRTHSRLSLDVSLFSCSGLPGSEDASVFGLASGDFRGLLLLPSKIDAIEKSDFMSVLPFLICYHTLHSLSLLRLSTLLIASPCTKRVSTHSNWERSC